MACTLPTLGREGKWGRDIEIDYHSTVFPQVVISGRRAQGAVTPIDSIVTTTTAVRQWSTVKAAQKGVVNGQSMLRNTVNADNGT